MLGEPEVLGGRSVGPDSSHTPPLNMAHNKGNVWVFTSPALGLSRSASGIREGEGSYISTPSSLRSHPFGPIAK